MERTLGNKLLAQLRHKISQRKQKKQLHFRQVKNYGPLKDIDKEEKLDLDNPTANGVVFTALRLMDQCAQKKANFAASQEVFRSFVSIINELTIDDDLKVRIKSNEDFHCLFLYSLSGLL